MCWTWSGFCYTSFITDAFARRIVGWRVSKSLRTDLALDTLEMAICTRNGEDLSPTRSSFRPRSPISGYSLHRSSGDEQAVTSVGSKGDSYDNALAETVNGLYKTELIYRQGPGRRWSNRAGHRRLGQLVERQRLHEACDYVPPAEFEENYYRRLGEPISAA